MRRIFISFKIEDRAKAEGFRLLARNPRVDFFYDESVRRPFSKHPIYPAANPGKDTALFCHCLSHWQENPQKRVG